MNFKSISFYLSLFCFPISLLSFINILYSSYFDYFLSIESYFLTLIFMKEGINIKTGTILVLATMIIILQVFWKYD